MDNAIINELKLTPTIDGLRCKDDLLSEKIQLQELVLNIIKYKSVEKTPSKEEIYQIPLESIMRIGNSNEIIIEALLEEGEEFDFQKITLTKQDKIKTAKGKDIIHQTILAEYKTGMMQKVSKQKILFEISIDFSPTFLSASTYHNNNMRALLASYQAQSITNYRKLIPNLSLEDKIDIIGQHYDGFGRIYILVFFSNSLKLYLISYLIHKQRFTFKEAGKLDKGSSTRIQAGIECCDDIKIVWSLLLDNELKRLTIPR